MSFSFSASTALRLNGGVGPLSSLVFGSLLFWGLAPWVRARNFAASRVIGAIVMHNLLKNLRRRSLTGIIQSPICATAYAPRGTRVDHSPRSSNVILPVL